ncbi:hypothetical protein [Streptomyces sp. NPDC059788]|uniref:hypothetical protein n=1 Tax=Streptomyces sp. NPDC059788 TaxID=3346948 RepID=UPI003660418D
MTNSPAPPRGDPPEESDQDVTSLQGDEAGAAATSPDAAPSNSTAKSKLYSAGVLTLIVIALVLSMNLFVHAKWWRLAITVSACAIIVAITLLIPRSWRVRLGTVAGIFVAASGVLPILLIDPGDEEGSPEVDSTAMAAYVERGPFDQRLPTPLLADGITLANVGKDSGAKKLTAVELKIKVDPKYSPFVPGDDNTEQFAIAAYLEVYPDADDATVRGTEAMRHFKHYDTPAQEDTNVGLFCFQGVTVAAFWECGGVRGNSYAEVTLSPGDNAHLGLARDTVTALLNYSDSMARKATPRK